MIVGEHVLERLEWPRVLEMIAGHLRLPMGHELVSALRPESDAERLAEAHDRADEMRRLERAQGRLPLTTIPNPAPIWAALRVHGRVLSASEVYETVALMSMARETSHTLRKLDADSFPRLGAEWARFPDLDGVLATIDGNVTPAGHVEDHASPELGRIRREIRHLSERLTRILERLLEAEWTGPVLRDKFITLRNNRFVLPVRVDTPRRFPGIVHARSATEKTLFVEPLETVDINNQLVRLKEEEQEEVERILAGYTALLRVHREDLEQTSRVLGELDLLEAIALWADIHDACRPQLVCGGGIRMRRARHPVLERMLAGSEASVVPLDVDLARDLNVLVVSGPNAGGKTVALKTMGLLTLMAHAGLPVPADEAQMPRFAMVLADIGDQQSIEGGLSTFSSHIKNLAEMIRQARPPALALVDEIGTGTDPAEGAALGISVLERLRGDGVHVVATTHHQSIKAWAYRTEGVLNAAVDFDEETLSPTYRLVPGVAGASIGLTMALKLGLEESVVVDARRRLDPAGEEASQALDAIRALASDLERQRAELVARRRQIETKAELQRVKLEGERERLRSDWSSRVERLVSEFRKEADRMISRLASTQDKRRLARQRAGMERELKQQFAVAAPPVGPPPEGWMPEPGDRVGVASLGREGVVHSVRGARAEIDLGRSRFSVAVEDLRPIEAAAETNNETRARTAGGRSEPGRHQLPPVESAAAQFADRTVAPELHLLGQRVEEAMATLDKYLDDAYLAGLAEVRVVHGIGTGRLRRAVRERLDDHLEVVSWREARPEEGGAGATIVRLAEETP